MSITIELPEETCSKLLEFAAERGGKELSSIIQEALERYFERSEERRERVDRALVALGSLDTEDAEILERHVDELRRPGGDSSLHGEGRGGSPGAGGSGRATCNDAS